MENSNYKNLLTKFPNSCLLLSYYDNYFNATLLMNKLCKETKEIWESEFEAYQTRFSRYKRALEYTDLFDTKFRDYLVDHQKYLHYKLDIWFENKEGYQLFIKLFFEKVPETHRSYLEFKKIQIDEIGNESIEHANTIYDHLCTYQIDYKCLLLDLEDISEYSSGKDFNYINQLYDYKDSVRKHGNVKEITSVIICKLEDQLLNMDVDYKVRELNIEDGGKTGELSESNVSSFLRESVGHLWVQEEKLDVGLDGVRNVFNNLRVLTVHNRHQSIWYDWRREHDMIGKEAEMYKEILDITPKTSEQWIIFKNVKFYYVQNDIFYEGIAQFIKFENIYVCFESQASENYIYAKQFEIITNCNMLTPVESESIPLEVKQIFEANCDENFDLDYESEVIFENKNWSYFYYEETSFNDNRWLYEILEKSSSFNSLEKVHMSITEFKDSDLPKFPRGVKIDLYVYLTEINKSIFTKISEIIAYNRVRDLDVKFDLDYDEIDTSMRPDFITNIWSNTNLKTFLVRYFDVKSGVELGCNLRNLNLDPPNFDNSDYAILHKFLTSLLNIDNVKDTYMPKLKDKIIIE
jgi:hypothetical protein